MKKVILFFSILFLSATFTFGQLTATLGVSELGPGVPAGQVTTSVTVDDIGGGDNFGTFQIYLLYDPAVLTPTNVNFTNANLPFYEWTNNLTFAADEIILTWLSFTSGYTPTPGEELCTIDWDYTGDPDRSDITFNTEAKENMPELKAKGMTAVWTSFGGIYTLSFNHGGVGPDIDEEDLGIDDIIEPITGEDLTAAEPVTVAITNYGDNAQTGFDVNFSVDGGTAVTETVSATVNPGETYNYTFTATADLSAYGTYDIDACVILAGDVDPTNDCAMKTVENLEPANEDLGIDDIIDPVSGQDLTAAEPVTVAITNYGDNTQSGFDVYFTLDGGAAVTETVAASIDPGNTYNYTFTATVDLSVYGMYDIEACVVLPGDVDPTNDCAMKTVENMAPGLCVPIYTTGCSLGDGFTDFELEEISNMGSGCEDLNGVGWSQYLGLGPATLQQGATHTITMATGYDNNYVDVWIDFNDDLVLTADELVLDNFLMGTAGTFYTADITIPADAALGQHYLRARTNWNSEVLDPCDELAYGEAEDYYINVIEYIPPEDCENFDALTVGDYVALQLGGYWTTWSGTPGGADDALVTDVQSNSPNNSFVVDNAAIDVVLELGDAAIEAGAWLYSHYTYVPTGYSGYFNVQSDPAPGVAWVVEIYFDDGGTGSFIHDGTTETFDYTQDTWFMVEINFDLDADLAQIFFDGTLIYTFPTTNTIGGIDYFGANTGGTPGAYYDDVCFGDGVPITPLNPPLNLEASVSGSDVALTWDPPASDKANISQGSGMVIGNPVSEKDPFAKNEPIPSDAQFDLLFDFPVGVGGGEAGIETDGSFIYTSMWNGAGEFQKYELDGTWLETFTIAGAAGCRDIAYNGTYFYGGAASTTVFEMDFGAGTMVSTFSAPTDCRAIAYNEVDDAFYANNWGSNITKFDMAGANLGSFPVGPVGDSYYGMAFDNYSGGPFLWGYAQVGTTQNELVQIELPSGTETGVYFDVGSVAAVGTGIAGGLCIDGTVVPDFWTLIGTSQNVNIWGLELVAAGQLTYNVYRDGLMIGSTMNLNFNDNGLDPGIYEYYVTAVYPEGESQPSNSVTVTIEGTWEPPIPQNLEGPVEVYTNEDIVLTWDEIGGEEWIQWDQGVNNGSAVGLTNGGTFSCASHWLPDELTAYNGWTIEKISFFPSGDPDATFTIKVWVGAAGTTEVLSQDVTSFTIDQFNEVELTTPITINASQDLWFGYEVSHLAGTFPAGTDDGPAIQYSGDMITTGGAWESLYVLTSGALDYNWNIAALVTLGDGSTAPLGKEVEFAANDGSFQASPATGNTVKFIPTATKDFQGYNVYRDGSLLGFTVQTTYTDVVTAIGQYTYNVTSLWDEGESDFSNDWVVDVISGVNEHVFNSTELFPNPATDVVNVRSDYLITALTIYNHAGQEVAKEEVSGFNFQINTANYNAGLYLFQIDTEEGRISKRIIIE